MEKKKSGISGAYAKKVDYEWEGKEYEADIKNGDKVTILNSGDTTEGKYGEQKVFSIKTRNGEKNFTFNQPTVNVLIEAFGDDSNKWIGKEVKVLTKKDVIAGKKVIITYLVTEGWSLDDYGELVKEGQDSPDKVKTIEYPEEDIDPNDIPF